MSAACRVFTGTAGAASLAKLFKKWKRKSSRDRTNTGNLHRSGFVNP